MKIDRDKFRSAVCGLNDESIRNMLDDAIGLLPMTKLVKLAGQYLDVNSLKASEPSCSALLTEVKAFDKASRKGDYYEGFSVNSKNYREMSGGTRTWNAECNRLLDCCVKAGGNATSAEVVDAFEILFALLRRLDEGLDDIIFFADEGGSWQVGVDWSEVLPVWIACLTAVAEPDDYAQRVVDTVDYFERYDRDKHLKKATQKATAEQRKALAEKISSKKPKK